MEPRTSPEPEASDDRQVVAAELAAGTMTFNDEAMTDQQVVDLAVGPPRGPGLRLHGSSPARKLKRDAGTPEVHVTANDGRRAPATEAVELRAQRLEVAMRAVSEMAHVDADDGDHLVAELQLGLEDRAANAVSSQTWQLEDGGGSDRQLRDDGQGE